MWEAEIRKIMIRDQPRDKVHENLSHPINKTAYAGTQKGEY
jgi:hypothetical protein